MKAYLTNPNLKRRRKNRQRHSERQRLSAKQIFIGTSSILAAAFTGLLIYFQMGNGETAIAASTGDFRTVSSGNWHTPRTWETFNGSEWVSTNTPPNASSNTIFISSGHTVIINTKVSADQVVVSKDGKLVTENGTLKITNGEGTDLLVKGEMEIKGSLEISKDAIVETENTTLFQDAKIDLQGQLIINGKFVNNGGKMQIEKDHITVKDQGTYEHAFDGGSLPIAKWEKNSFCEITGVFMTIPQNFDQAFGNFKWNSSTQAIPVDFADVLCQVQNDVYITSTGTRDVFFDKTGKLKDILINGNLYIQGGSVCVNPYSENQIAVKGNVIVSNGNLSFNSKNSTANSSMRIDGELNITGGIIDLNSSPSAKKGTLDLKGNISVNGIGLVTETSGGKGGEIIFSGNKKVQLIVVNNNIKNRIDYNVQKGSTLRLDNYNLTGNGDFNLNDGAGLMIGSPMGITKSEMSGNIQNKGARNFSTKAVYTYNGGTEQKTGNALPSIVYALIIDNEENCKLQSTTSVSNLLSLETGRLITDKHVLSLGVSETSTGTLNKNHGYVVGNFRRWINSTTIGQVEFPVGNFNSTNSAILNFTQSPKQGGAITCNLGVGNVNKMGLPMSDGGDVCMNAGYAYWSLTPDNGFNGGVFDLSLAATGFPGIQNYEKLHISQRENLYTPWRTIGKHEKAIGTNDNAVALRKNVSELGIFGITSGSSNSLPTDMVYFSAHAKNNHVELNWEMTCEMNSDYFAIERSINGSDFTAISTVKGAGNSQQAQNYQFSDYKPLTGTSYYRLKQVSFEGKTTTSNIERVNLKSRVATASSVNIQRVGPNPFNSMVTAEYYAESNGDVAVEILSKDGKSIFKTYQYALKGYNTFTFNKGSTLSPGDYMIRLSNSDGATREFITKAN
ncbi:MAG: hypothetical protein IPI10_07200 [Bacteroidetes bacterium]|nr:hypothetical protein [Bacteroidota bacterium]